MGSRACCFKVAQTNREDIEGAPFSFKGADIIPRDPNHNPSGLGLRFT